MENFKLAVRFSAEQVPCPAGFDRRRWYEKRTVARDFVTGRFAGFNNPGGEILVASVDEATEVLKRLEGLGVPLDEATLWSPLGWGHDIRDPQGIEKMRRDLAQDEQDLADLAEVVEILRPVRADWLRESGYDPTPQLGDLLGEARKVRETAKELGQDAEFRALLTELGKSDQPEAAVAFLQRLEDFKSRGDLFGLMANPDYMYPRQKAAWLYGAGRLLGRK